MLYIFLFNLRTYLAPPWRSFRALARHDNGNQKQGTIVPCSVAVRGSLWGGLWGPSRVLWGTLASISTCLLALESVRGRLGGHLGRGFKKTSKKSLLETLLLDQICDRYWHCCGDVFHMFSKPLYFHLFAPAGAHMTQFRRLLATKLGTD